MAGAITAALFLRRFAAGAPRYAHFDVYGWQQAAAPGRPKGGVGQGARALLDAAGLDNVGVEATEAGDHYDPVDKMVRLSASNFGGRSLTGRY